MAKAQELVEQVRLALNEEERLDLMSEIIMFPIPVRTFKKLSEAAVSKNMTVAQVLAKAIDNIISENDSKED